ncbi:MAG TPA: DinB family protein [Acidimicrobiales bacterium]
MGVSEGEWRDASFERVDMSGARFRVVDLRGARFEHADMRGVVMRGVELCDVAIDGEVVNVTINGVDIAPLVEAELDRRDPERAKMRPTDPDGFREAWDIVERRWRETVAHARQLERRDPALLHESVDGEWSFVQTLRHLLFATDAWIRRVVLGDPSPWDALDLPFDQMTPNPAVPWDRAARPSLDEVLALRADRMATMRGVVDGLTDEMLQSSTTPVDAPGWPRPNSYAVRDCILIVLNEEWHHRLYAERDLAVLESRRW